MVLGYATPRTSFTLLLVLFTCCFGGYLYITNHRINLWHGIAAAILFRVLLLFATPALSFDYLRLLWDGHVLAAGLNPYAHLPATLLPNTLQVAGITRTEKWHLIAPAAYSTNLPVALAVGWLGAKLSSGNLQGSVVIIRLVLVLADIGSILLLLRLLRKMAVPEKHLLLYALNPLVILELTGNLHTEALLIFFLLLTLLLLFQLRVVPAGLAFGLAIGVKLLPLLFLPFVLRRLSARQFAVFGLVLLLTLAGLFFPLLSTVNPAQFLTLYFQQPSFNASLYYVLRWLAMQVALPKLVPLLPLLLAAATAGAILSMAAVKRLGSTHRLMGYMAATLTVCLLLNTTVQPWHIPLLLALTIVSHFRFAVVWSGLIILPYAAYHTQPVAEHLLLTALEHGLVIAWMLAELYLYRQRRKQANLVS